MRLATLLAVASRDGVAQVHARTDTRTRLNGIGFSTHMHTRWLASTAASVFARKTCPLFPIADRTQTDRQTDGRAAKNHTSACCSNNAHSNASTIKNRAMSAFCRCFSAALQLGSETPAAAAAAVGSDFAARTASNRVREIAKLLCRCSKTPA